MIDVLIHTILFIIDLSKLLSIALHAHFHLQRNRLAGMKIVNLNGSLVYSMFQNRIETNIDSSRWGVFIQILNNKFLNITGISFGTKSFY